MQGARALSTFGGRFSDPELSPLASSLPLRCLGAKADSTTERYSRAFEKFRVWAASYKEISVLPTNFLHVATYLEFLYYFKVIRHIRLWKPPFTVSVGRVIFLDFLILAIPTL